MLPHVPLSPHETPVPVSMTIWSPLHLLLFGDSSWWKCGWKRFRRLVFDNVIHWWIGPSELGGKALPSVHGALKSNAWAIVVQPGERDRSTGSDPRTSSGGAERSRTSGHHHSPVQTRRYVSLPASGWLNREAGTHKRSHVWPFNLRVKQLWLGDTRSFVSRLWRITLPGSEEGSGTEDIQSEHNS